MILMPNKKKNQLEVKPITDHRVYLFHYSYPGLKRQKKKSRMRSITSKTSYFSVKWEQFKKIVKKVNVIV